MTWTTVKIFATLIGSRPKVKSVPKCDQPTLLIMYNNELVFITFIRLEREYIVVYVMECLVVVGGVVQQWNFNLSMGRDKYTILLMDCS